MAGNGPDRVRPDPSDQSDSFAADPLAISEAKLEILGCLARKDSALRLTFEPGVQDEIRERFPSLALPLSTRECYSSPAVAGPGQGTEPNPVLRRTVPEPTSMVLLVTGLVGLAARRRLLLVRYHDQEAQAGR